MQVSEGKVVAIKYTLKDDDGDVVDSNQEGAPLPYLHGARNIVKGLETALEGKQAGDQVAVMVPPADGYGEWMPGMEISVPRDRFPQGENLEPGLRFQAPTKNGPHVFTITEISDENIKADGNHPLAGENLHFEVEVVEVRDATQEELDHGHVHGPGGHHH